MTLTPVEHSFNQAFVTQNINILECIITNINFPHTSTTQICLLNSTPYPNRTKLLPLFETTIKYIALLLRHNRNVDIRTISGVGTICIPIPIQQPFFRTFFRQEVERQGVGVSFSLFISFSWTHQRPGARSLISEGEFRIPRFVASIRAV